MRSLSRVDALLSQPTRRVDRVKSSVTLDRHLYEGFRDLCEHRGLTQSEVLDALLADLLARHPAAPPSSN